MPEDERETSRFSTLLEAALGYVALGIPVFPVWWVDGENCACREADCDSQGKHPITASGFKDATTSPDTVRRWWGRYPKAGVAGVCGKESGFIVLDVDPRHGGDATGSYSGWFRVRSLY